ncbi:hypothetical protein B0T22DRAFT_378982 [Podospora appendiculata]|uniref:HTH APSES-type domain-containing protein n=1 Tax=Podospora appendiculata TaxID=314037 RepID=A0AAE0X8F4_9PEZI|nr:hypothetical protein B0T22DRAFT_378982 [Podospora appendiculata]
MAPNRHLPARHNPLLVEDVPPHAELAARRRLGQTQLTARMIAAVPGAEVDTESLGAFDYAHLRAPLQKGIMSGIFKSSPPSYFLMRRSQDGFVSATGMFKATFPYASQEEEEAERRYIKSLPTTSPEETAGNVWISPDQALALAEEYQIVPWIRALLDPSDIAITTGVDSSPPKKIHPPPKYFSAQPALAPPSATSARTSRSRRSASPTKATAAKRATASPRKRRAPSSQSSITTEAALESQTSTLVNGEIPSQIFAPVHAAPSVAKVESTDGEVKIESIEHEPAVALQPVEEEPKIKIQVDQDVKVDEAGEEVTHTKVEVEVPLIGELPSAEDAAKMVADAKAMVEAAFKSVSDAPEASASSSTKNKRKADEIAEDDESAESGAVQAPQAKRVKTEAELRKEKIRKRTYIGLGATVAVGAVSALFPIIGPYIMNVL